MIAAALAFLGVTSALRGLAIAGIASTLAFGAGYVSGYRTADNSAAVRTATARIAALELDLKAQKDAADAAEKQAAWLSQTTTENAVIEQDIENVIAKSPRIDGCVGGAFLQRLHKLK